jgi:hypothetical protein
MADPGEKLQTAVKALVDRIDRSSFRGLQVMH